MVNVTIANYLKDFGDKYKLDDLRREIISKGYTEDEFNEALNVFRKKDEDETQKSKLMHGVLKPLPTHKFLSEKKNFGWLKFVFILFGILIFGVCFVLLFNFLDMSFFGFNVTTSSFLPLRIVFLYCLLL